MNLQEIFNTIYLHAQKKEEARQNNSCKYRTDDGRKCFIGCLIPDDKYVSDIEGSVPSLNLDKAMLGAPKAHINDILDKLNIDKPLYKDLVCLQSIHDSNFPGDWNKLLNGFASAHNLTIPSVS